MTNQGNSTDTYREVELKLRVSEDFQLPDLTQLADVATVTKQHPIDLTAVYHDTADLSLFRWRVTLRRRTGGHDAGWHLKLPVDGHDGTVRDELSTPLSAGEVGHVPPALSDLVTALTLGEPLQPVTTICNHRTPYLLMTSDGSAIAELVDDHVSVLDDGVIKTRFHEIEIEALTQKVESQRVLDNASDLLQSLGGIPEHTSKAASALGPQAAAPANVVRRPNPNPGDPAGDAVAALLAKHVRRFVLQDVRVRRDLPDSVHKMRVAARRLRSGLDTFGPLVDKQWARHLRQELKWLAAELGPARDTEVVSARLLADADELPPSEADLARAAIELAMAQQSTAARTQVNRAMHTDRYETLLGELVAAAADPLLTKKANRTCEQVLPALVDRAWRRLNKETRLLGSHAPSSTWHEARKKAKKARYAAEAVEPVFGDPANQLAQSLEEVTEVLGEHQDSHVAQSTLKTLAGESDGDTGFCFGVMSVMEARHETELRREFQMIWPRTRSVHQHIQLDQ